MPAAPARAAKRSSGGRGAAGDVMRMVRMAATIAVALAAGFAGCGGGKVVPPAGLPDDLPLPRGGVLRSAQDLGPRAGVNLVFELGEDAGRAGGEHRARMEAAGWRLVAEVALERGEVVSWRKGGRSAAVGVAPAGPGSLLSIGYVAAGVDGGGGEPK